MGINPVPYTMYEYAGVGRGETIHTYAYEYVVRKCDMFGTNLALRTALL